MNRPIELQMRADLIVSPRSIGNKRFFVIKDPITLRHHQLWEEEFSLLKMLDGKTSFAQMRDAFIAQFSNTRIDFNRLQWLHGQFHRNGLVVSNGYGQAEELYRRYRSQRSGERWGKFKQWMSIRFRGINPDRFFSKADTRVGWIFDAWTILVVSWFIALTAVFFVASYGAVLYSKIPVANGYLTLSNVAWLFVAFGLLKVIHEIGHGLACKHYGGECNELGLMLLVFTPCLYCDVTDSWMIVDKWKRAMISFAGIWFEWIVASLCAWVWWFSHPGIVNTICFHTMLVASVGTLIFNGNPLLKYDGYFVLSDLMNWSNLAQKANAAMADSTIRYFVKTPSRVQDDPAGRGSLFLLLYGFVSGLYRILLTAVLMLVVYRVFQILKLELVGLLLILSVLAGATWSVASSSYAFVFRSRQKRAMRRGRITTTAVLAIAIVAMIAWVPLPAKVRAPVLIKSLDAQTIVVLVEGNLVYCAAEGTQVHEGDEIARIKSPDLELSLSARRGELSRQRAKLVGLESRRSDDPSVAPQIPTVREAIAGLEFEVERLESEVSQLVLRAPMDGTILAPPKRTFPLDHSEVEFWSGSPIESENMGCFLKRGAVLCQIGRTDQCVGTILLSQANVELVRPGQRVVIKSKEYPSSTISGSIADIGTTDHPTIPLELSRSGLIPQRMNDKGEQVTSEPMYAAKITIAQAQNGSSAPLSSSKLDVPIHQSIAEADIRVAPMSVGHRLVRLVYSTFAIDPTVQQKSDR